MSYVQFLELVLAVMLALPIFGNLGVVIFRNSHPRIAYWCMRMSAIAVAVAKAPKDQMIQVAATELAKEVFASPLPESAPASMAAEKVAVLVSTEPKPAPPVVATMALMLVLGGCAASEKLIETLHDVEDLNDAQTAIANEAKPCFIAEADRDELACNGDALCIAKVRANANRRADLYDLAHAKQCKLNPLLVGCEPKPAGAQ